LKSFCVASERHTCSWPIQVVRILTLNAEHRSVAAVALVTRINKCYCRCVAIVNSMLLLDFFSNVANWPTFTISDMFSTMLPVDVCDVKYRLSAYDDN